MAQDARPEARTPNPWPTFALCSVAAFLVLLDMTILFVAFHGIRRAFAAAPTGELSWVLNAYTIVLGALLVPAGRLADLYGRKRLFLIGVALFTGASGLCGGATSAWALVGFRVLQAIGAACLLPASLALILSAFPREQRSIAVSLWGAVGALAAAVGPSLGGSVVAAFGWPWAFWINVPVGLVGLALSARRLTESRSVELGALPDVPGILMLIGGVSALALGVVKSSDWGWASPASLGAIVAGLAVLVGFVRWASRVETPALDLTLFRDPTYRFANLATFVFSVTFTAMFFGFFFFMTRVWGYSLPKAGLAPTPGPLMVIPVAILAGRQAAWLGHRPLLVAGGLIYALGASWFYVMAGPTPHFLRDWLPGMLLGGAGVGLLVPSLTGAAVFGLPPQRFGVGSAVNQSIRQMGAVFGVALVVVLVGRAFGSVALESFRIHFLVLITGGLATALLSLPIDTRPARARVHTQSPPVTRPRAGQPAA
jgi:EmrB/QacA subfamily drug resistance transporter